MTRKHSTKAGKGKLGDIWCNTVKYPFTEHEYFSGRLLASLKSPNKGRQDSEVQASAAARRRTLVNGAR